MRLIAVILFVMGLMLGLSSCQKKKAAEPAPQRVDNYVPPATESDLDTTQAYTSPSDQLSDRSTFTASHFQSAKASYRGSRNIRYQISMGSGTAPVLVVEYLDGAWTNGDSTSTVSRILVYAGSELVYRKAFPLEFTGSVNFSRVRKLDHTVLTVTKSKSILYYWFEIVEPDGAMGKEYHAVAVDNDGLTNELTGDLTRIGGSYRTVRFLNENRLKAKVAPGPRYPNLAVDLLLTIDWTSCTSTLDVPVDTVFSVSDQPSRFFSNRIKLYPSPTAPASAKETNFRKLTQAQMQRAYIPSFFDSTQIERDRLFIEFNRTTSGWIDHGTIVFEEIQSER